MSLITAARLSGYVDWMCQYYRHTQGNSTAGVGVGDLNGSFGAAADATRSYQSLAAELLLETNTDVITKLNTPITTVGTRAAAVTRAKTELLGTLAGLESHCRGAGTANVTSLDTALKYYNIGAGGTYTAAVDGPSWRDLYYSWKTAYPSAYNCYQEVLQGTFDQANHLYTNGLGKFVVSGAGAGTFTKAVVEGLLVDGGSAQGFIDYTKYAAGVPRLKVSSLAGSGNLTITGSQYDPATQTVTAGKTWITSVTANGTVDVAVGAGTATSGAIIIGVTNITIAAGITAGTMYVENQRPSIHASTSTAGGAGTITLATTATLADSAYLGLQIAHAADSPVYTKTTITSYTGATRIALVSAWGANPSTTAYRIYRPFILNA